MATCSYLQSTRRWRHPHRRRTNFRNPENDRRKPRCRCYRYNFTWGPDAAQLFIRARAPKVGGPIVFRRICVSFLGLFQGLDMMKALPKFAGNSKPQIVIVFWSNLKWRGKMAQQRPLERSPWVHIDRSSQKLIHRCIMTRQTKKSKCALWKTHQEAHHFGFSGHLPHLPHFYFDKLVPGLSSDQLHTE